MAEYQFIQDLEKAYRRKLENCFEIIRIYEKLNEEGQKALIYYGQGLLDGGMTDKQSLTV